MLSTLKITPENGNSLREDFQVYVRQTDNEKWELKQRNYKLNAPYFLKIKICWCYDRPTLSISQ